MLSDQRSWASDKNSADLQPDNRLLTFQDFSAVVKTDIVWTAKKIPAENGAYLIVARHGINLMVTLVSA